ncbi:hypothetical protein GE061_011995 [Apolygus lucorum]|uniref:Ig-like domain-containing protein n=1 Tax=Apolygus lucorum TaxID=248454 RepID=A0A8S9XRA4_APOLU|nr:hypothetical protein GE061_011995 [Apolygus lucorum]
MKKVAYRGKLSRYGSESSARGKFSPEQPTRNLKKTFESPPYSMSVEVDRQAEIRCHPPVGMPLPRVYWLRNGVPLEPSDTNIIMSSEGHLLVNQARLQDTANYSCVAENIAARRVSDPAALTVYGFMVNYITYALMK